jgi:hypothetical protein
MALTLTVTSATFGAIDAANPIVEIRGIANFGTYATGGIEMTAAIVNAALLASGLHAGCTVSAVTDCEPGHAADYVTATTFVVASNKIMGWVVATHAQYAELDLSNASYNFPVTIWATKA